MLAIEPLEPRIAPATFIVATLDDAGAGSLREAIVSANSRPGADVIVFKPGLTGTIKVSTGQMRITDALTIKGPGATKLALDADRLSRFFDVSDGDNNLDSPFAISGLAFYDGKEAVTGAFAESGGAMVCFESLSVKGCVFVGNHSGRDGGAIFEHQSVDGKPLRVEIRNSSFLSNTADRFGGGALDLSVGGSIALKNNIFSGNATSFEGGAANLRVGTNETLLVQNCKFLGNHADQGGGLIVQGVFGGGDCNIVVRDSLFANNQADSDSGGAALFAGKITIDHTAFVGNQAGGGGGGLRALGFTSLDVRSSRFLDNTSSVLSGGGGLKLDIVNGGVARIVASVISGNTARTGGGILVTAAPGELQIVRSTIANNHATTGSGGGVLVERDASDESADLSIARSKVIGNVTETGEGGGVAVFGTGKFTMSGSQVMLNVAGVTGGGVALFNTTPSTIVGSLIAENRADSGGGIGAAISLEVRASKVLDNTADLGGGIGTTANLQLNSTLVAGNTAEAGGGIFHAAGTSIALEGRSKVIRNFSPDGQQMIEL